MLRKPRASSSSVFHQGVPTRPVSFQSLLHLFQSHCILLGPRSFFPGLLAPPGTVLPLLFTIQKRTGVDASWGSLALTPQFLEGAALPAQLSYVLTHFTSCFLIWQWASQLLASHKSPLASLGPPISREGKTQFPGYLPPLPLPLEEWVGFFSLHWEELMWPRVPVASI